MIFSERGVLHEIATKFILIVYTYFGKNLGSSEPPQPPPPPQHTHTHNSTHRVMEFHDHQPLTLNMMADI
jgi:hypothetical protein